MGRFFVDKVGIFILFMKHLTKNRLKGLAYIGLVFLCLFGVYSFFSNTGTQTRVGVMRNIGQVEYPSWGLETSKNFLGIPLYKQYYSISDTPVIYQLPEDFKVDGLAVKVKFEIIDVIGMADWDVVIRPIDVTKISK